MNLCLVVTIDQFCGKDRHMVHQIETDAFETEDNHVTPVEAVAILKRCGVWERLLDGEHTLRLIVGGVVETQWLCLDARKRLLKSTRLEYDCDGSRGAFFTLCSKDRRFRESYDEFTETFEALLRLLD